MAVLRASVPLHGARQRPSDFSRIGRPTPKPRNPKRLISVDGQPLQKGHPMKGALAWLIGIPIPIIIILYLIDVF